MQKADTRLAVTMRGSVESSREAHGTHLHIFERHQSGDAVATNNHFGHVQRAKMRMPCCSKGKAQQLSCTGRAGPPESTHVPYGKGRSTYVRALGNIFEAGRQPVKNRKMRNLAQRGNQAMFFHRMQGIQRSPVAYNLQHLREYNSCRIWVSQSRRPPYVADVEGRARIEGVVASIHESYMDAHGKKVAEDAVFKTPCVVIIFDETPNTGRSSRSMRASIR